jgi:hypothetical protein
MVVSRAKLTCNSGEPRFMSCSCLYSQARLQKWKLAHLIWTTLTHSLFFQALSKGGWRSAAVERTTHFIHPAYNNSQCHTLMSNQWQTNVRVPSSFLTHTRAIVLSPPHNRISMTCQITVKAAACEERKRNGMLMWSVSKQGMLVAKQ